MTDFAKIDDYTPVVEAISNTIMLLNPEVTISRVYTEEPKTEPETKSVWINHIRTDNIAYANGLLELNHSLELALYLRMVNNVQQTEQLARSYIMPIFRCFHSNPDCGGTAPGLVEVMVNNCKYGRSGLHSGQFFVVSFELTAYVKTYYTVPQ
jgi:hypothetical protein